MLGSPCIPCSVHPHLSSLHRVSAAGEDDLFVSVACTTLAVVLLLIVALLLVFQSPITEWLAWLPCCATDDDLYAGVPEPLNLPRRQAPAPPNYMNPVAAAPAAAVPADSSLHHGRGHGGGGGGGGGAGITLAPAPAPARRWSGTLAAPIVEPTPVASMAVEVPAASGRKM